MPRREFVFKAAYQPVRDLLLVLWGCHWSRVPELASSRRLTLLQHVLDPMQGCHQRNLEVLDRQDDARVSLMN
jgi:hypothetical protein